VATEPSTAPAEIPAPEPVEAEDATLSQHETDFPVTSRRAPPVEPPNEGEPAEKPKRHRAASAEASPRDVPRINELTRKLREAEAERDALKAAPRVADSPPRSPAPAAPPPPAPRPAAATGRPTLQTFLDKTADYTTAVEEYTDALTDWKRGEWDRQQAETQKAQRLERDNQRVLASWKTRVDAAMAEYPDFKAVALEAPTTIVPGSMIDAWILKSPVGAKLLYALQKDPAELQRIQTLRDEDGEIDAVAQAEALSLLSQRLTASSRVPAVATGAVATPPKVSAPRPPTPVRTGPMHTDDAPPGDEASLAEHEAYYTSHRRR
jgi:hypothetical protein